MVHDIIMNSLDRPEIVMSQDVLDTMVSLRQWMFENVYKNPAAKAEEGKAQQLIVRLYEYSYGACGPASGGIFYYDRKKS